MATAAFDPAAETAPSTYKAVFDEVVPTIAVVVSPKGMTGAMLGKLRGWVLARRGLRAVWDEGESAKAIYLCPAKLKECGVDQAAMDSLTSIDGLPRDLVTAIGNVTSENASTTVGIRKVSFTVNAACFTMEETLARLLPRGVVVPSGFEQVGHIAHVNLQDAQLPYKRLIGQVLLDSNRVGGVRTVVHKIEIASQFRELKLELIAGEADMNARVRQHGIDFVVPFDKVYWNSKLSREHERLVNEHMRSGDHLFDVMAGIGPFVIPALRKGLVVWGNDLNPASVDAMKINAKNNVTAVEHRNFTPSCEDGREFIRRVRAAVLQRGAPASGTRHFVMNLPALAVTFLDAFGDSAWVDRPDEGINHDRTFRVHCYCFSKTSDPQAAAADAVSQCEKNLGHTLRPQRDVHQVHVVRDVAPNKLMVCVSFSLPDSVFDTPRRSQPRAEAHASATR